MAPTKDSSSSASTWSGPAIGLDLGTTFSCIGVWQNERVEIIPNSMGNRTTPSYVAWTDEGERLIGDAAKNQASANPTKTVFDAKRLIGRKFSDRAVQSDIKAWPFAVEAGPAHDKPVISIGDKKLAPEEISAAVLSKLKADAEAYLGTPVHSAVVTVPAYFNEAQRRATRDAGLIAGLKVERIINEPTAAALAYGLGAGLTSDDATGGEKKVLVFDLGGGTFDVSVLSVEAGLFEVLATSGNTHLGGEDFDHRLMEHCIKEFSRRVRSAGDNMRSNARAMRRLRTACERVKRTLSHAKTAVVEVEAAYEGHDLRVEISRAKFEALCGDLFRSCLDPVSSVLKDAALAKSDVDEVVLVGGSTRIPKIRELLQDYFNGKALSNSVHPDEAVAHGAAVQAAILAGEQGKALQDTLLVDVAPLSLGIETKGGVMTTIIPRQTRLPTSKTETFSTAVDNQPGVSIQVFQGERPRTVDCAPLGAFDLQGIPPAPRGVPQIQVKFDVDVSGLTTVTATETGTGKEAKIRIAPEDGSRLSEAELARMVAEAEAAKEADAAWMAKTTARNELESSAYAGRSMLDDKPSVADSDLGRAATAAIDAALAWLDSDAGLQAEVPDIKAEQDKLNAALHPAVAAANNNSAPDPESMMDMDNGPGSSSSGPTIEEVD